MEYEQFDTAKNCGEIIEIVIKILKENPQTTLMIANTLKIKRQGAYYYLKILKKRKMITTARINGRIWYGLKKEFREL